VQRQLAASKAKTADLVQAVYQGARDASAISGEAKPVKPPKRKRLRDAEVALLHLTDTHIGAVTSSYSTEVAERRIAETIEKTIRLTQIQRADHSVDECVVILGGDLIEQTGQFPHQAWAVDASTFEQLFDAARIIEASILRLLEEYQTVRVYLTPGNHGRVGRGKGRQSLDYESDTNWDRIVGRIIGERLAAQPRLEWVFPESWYSIVEVGAYRALAHHGDTIRSFGGNIPAYGILKKHLAWASGVMPEFQDAYLGHFHTPMQLAMNNGGRIFVTPSLVSDSSYAKEFVAATSLPAQRLHFVDPERGRVTAEYLVWVD
jgi:DNA repair exonuclease SbcCD nuclease subunit